MSSRSRWTRWGSTALRSWPSLFRRAVLFSNLAAQRSELTLIRGGGEVLQEWLKLASFPHRDDSPARIDCMRVAGLGNPSLSCGEALLVSEAEPCLELHHAACQPARRLAEARILDSRLVRSEANGLQVEFVEGVEEVPAQFEAGALPEKLHGGQTELLY